MIEDCVTKLKLTITVKRLVNIMTNKNRNNKETDSEIKKLANILAEKYTY